MIGIIGAMQEEIELLVARIESCNEKNFEGFDFFVGKLEGVSVVILRSGIGKVSAALGVAMMREHFQPDCIINTGSAAGLKSDMSVGDVVISSKVAYYDVDVTTFGYELGQVPKMPPAYEADQHLVELAEQSKGKEAIHTGLVVSGDSFIDDDAKVKQIASNFKDALALDMEAGAIAQACFMLNISFVIIRSISDVADNDAKMAHEEFLAIAAKSSSDMIVRVLDKIS